MSIASPLEQSTALRRPEILAPAGNMEMMRAAVENGADAVYFGLQAFNARLRASNLNAENLPEVMDYLHERGVRGYVTMNTLVFPAELADAEAALRRCSEAGVDAVLVQDLGLAWLANQIVPDLPIHASTQMTITGAEGVAAAEALGLEIERVVAAREMTRRDLKKMRAATEKDVEVFVHGAICVAYSGQCLTSEALGGRSANRGECAQACRLPYDLVVDGEKRDLADVKYLLSPKDLAAYEDIGDLVQYGIVSLKIEGRLKSPQYVAATVQSYRAAVDEAMREGVARLDEPTRRKLEMTFSRGFTGGYLHAEDHQAVVEGRFPKKRGLFLGRVVRLEKRGVLVDLEGPLRPGDGVVFDAGRPGGEEIGGRVFTMHAGNTSLKDGVDPLEDGVARRQVLLTFDHQRVDLRGVSEGQLLWKTSDPRLDAQLAASYADGKIHFRRPVWARVSGAVGQPLRLELVDEAGIRATVEDEAAAEAATNRPLNQEYLEKQLGRMGNTPVFLAGLEAALEGELMVPASRLNELRRRAVEGLLEARRGRTRGRRSICSTGILPESLNSDQKPASLPEIEPPIRSMGVSPMAPSPGTQEMAPSQSFPLPQFGITPDVQRRKGGNLPHWTAPNAAYHVCFRLADSIPAHVVAFWKARRQEIIATAESQNRPLSADEREELKRLYGEHIEKHLAQGTGSCLLRRPEAADLVADAIRFFDGNRYILHAWCVMPNHVHVLVQPLPGYKLEKILHAWKSFTAKQLIKAHRLSEKPVWQSESYDHLVRDQEQFRALTEYIWKNPEKANLPNWPWRGRREGIVVTRDSLDREEHGRDAHATNLLPKNSADDPKLNSSSGLRRDAHATGAAADSPSLLNTESGRAGEEGGQDARATARLSLLCRTLAQVEAAVSLGFIDTIYTDFEDIRLHQEARRLIPEGGARFAPATLRVIKPGEAGFVRVLLKAEPDAVLLRSLSAWEILRAQAAELPFIGDFSLNVANELTAFLLRRHGFSLLTPSYDLNMDQLAGLLRAAPPQWFEVTIHQYMPMFHMEHCVFCRFLSTGTNYLDCGRPCETHSVAVRDRMGYAHPVKADAGCRNTVFNAVAQSGSAYSEQMRALGVKRFRIDLLEEPPERVEEIARAYAPVLEGRESGADLWRRLQVHSKLGVTKGSLDHE